MCFMDKSDFSWKKPIAIGVIVFIAFLFGFGWGVKTGQKMGSQPPSKTEECNPITGEGCETDSEATPTKEQCDPADYDCVGSSSDTSSTSEKCDILNDDCID